MVAGDSRDRQIEGVRLVIHESLIERMFHALITGDAKLARKLIEQTLAADVTVDELVRETYRPIASMIESLSRAGQLTDRARDHATVLLQNLLDDAQAGQLQSKTASCEFETANLPEHEVQSRSYPRLSPVLNDAQSYGNDASSARPFVTLTYRDRVLRAKPAGPGLSQREATIIRQEIDRALDRVCHQLRSFVLDLSEVQSVSSYGLSVCVGLGDRVKSCGARSVMTGVNPRLVDLLSMLNADLQYDETTCVGEIAA